MAGLDPEDATRLLQRVPALFCIAGPDGRFVWVAPGWEQVLGYRVEELLSRSLADLVHPEDVGITRQTMARLDAGERITGFVNRHRHADGRDVWLEWHAGGSGGRYFGVAFDVSDRVRREQRAQESVRLLELAQALGNIGVWRIDLQTRELTWSREVYAIHGLEPGSFELTVERAVEAYHPDDRPVVAAHVADAIEKGRSFEFELRLRRADGELRWVVARGGPELDALGRPLAVHGIFQDLTERRALQMHVQDQERLRALSTMAAGLAHEINNPLQYTLTNVSLVVDMIEELRPSLAPEVHEELQSLLADCDQGLGQVSELVRDMRAFMAGAEPDAPRTEVDLNDVIETSIAFTRNDLRHRVRFHSSVMHLPRVRGRFSELVQVLVNLVHNALDAVQARAYAESRVEIRGSVDEHDHAVITVEDNGIGIPEVDHARIFEPFYTTKELGTGMGLFVSRGIIERHGGRLEVESAPGLTRFRVLLPGLRGSNGRDHAGRRPTMAVVDDDPLVGRAIERMMRDDFEVLRFVTADEALQRVLDPRGVDVILCDLMMPGTDGWEVLRQLQDLRPQKLQQTIIMTGGPIDDVADVVRHGVRLLPKPFRRRDLERCLASVRADSRDGAASVDRPPSPAKNS